MSVSTATSRLRACDHDPTVCITHHIMQVQVSSHGRMCQQPLVCTQAHVTYIQETCVGDRDCSKATSSTLLILKYMCHLFLWTDRGGKRIFRQLHKTVHQLLPNQLLDQETPNCGSKVSRSSFAHHQLLPLLALIFKTKIQKDKYTNKYMNAESKSIFLN